MAASMSGTLFVVATPIGNLEDITLRALRVLREVSVIAAEDTRRTRGLLSHYAIATSTVSFHEHNTRTRLPQLLTRLQTGADVALVTDAGTPSVSDPGIELVNACVDAEIKVDPVPGPSAPLAAAVASGFALVPFTFLGFPPDRSKARTEWFVAASTTRGTLCFFEAPHRIRRTLGDAQPYFGERPIVIGRELTKLHQEFLRGTAAELIERLNEPRGEFTVVVGPAQNIPLSRNQDVSDTDLANEFGRLTNSGALSRRAAITTLAQTHGRPARQIYAAIERAKSMSSDQ
jgi:16S rRNA (cytidine1402-2'-O)-methyltransferase